MRRTHGHTSHTGRNRHSPEYRIWCNMKTRCYNPRGSAFVRYGGRGISVCAEWRDSFETFLRDMGLRPSPKHSLDRIDNNGPYAPHNCRWATALEQVLNRSWTHLLTHEGETMPLTEWARRLGIRHQLLSKRISRRGWSVERALTTPPLLDKHRPRLLTHNGITRTQAAWARQLGITQQALSQRLKVLGWTLERALQS